MKLFDSEYQVMNVLWEQEAPMQANQIAVILKDKIDWNRNTTYTVIKKCIAKGAIERMDPKFLCKALITKKQAQEYAMAELIQKKFDGNVHSFFLQFVESDQIPEEKEAYLKQLIEDYTE